MAAVLCLPMPGDAQQRDSVVATGTPGNKADPKPRRWKAIHANEFQTPWFSIRIGGAMLPEFAAYEQDGQSRAQVAEIQGFTPEPEPIEPPDLRASPDLLASPDPPASLLSALPEPPSGVGSLPTAGRIRDSRFLLSGRLATKRSIAWSSGIMYDWVASKWFIRQTGFVVDVPEIYSNFWIGRTKEGPSLNRVTSGYDLWMMERFTFSDAAIPLLADGIRWQGYVPKWKLIWNLGGFIDVLSKGETFSYYEQQVAGRVGFVTMESAAAGNLVHVAMSFQFGTPTDDTLHLKSKPEAFGAPNFINTGKFPATVAQLVGLEVYRRTGSWLYGAEYFLEQARSPQTDNPVFSGGDVFVSWIMTGETREYIAPGSVFSAVSPAKNAFSGGPGAIEWVLRLSNIDLTTDSLSGGAFWRVTPGMNWYLSDNVRLEFEYGYGALTRFGTTGATQFFQSRLQLQL